MMSVWIKFQLYERSGIAYPMPEFRLFISVQYINCFRVINGRIIILLGSISNPEKNEATEMNLQITKTLKCYFTLVVVLVMSSCVNQETIYSDAGLVDVYTLTSINGNQVPASVFHQGATLQVLSGTFTIKANGTCDSKTVFVPPSGSEVVREVTAIYTQDGSRLTMQWKGAGITFGSVQDNTFTMVNEGMVFVYRK